VIITHFTSWAWVLFVSSVISILHTYFMTFSCLSFGLLLFLDVFNQNYILFWSFENVYFFKYSTESL
jgi:hypothetical protein